MDFIERFNLLKKYKKIYIRDELCLKEIRTPIIPSDVSILISNGFEVYIQKSDKRIYSNESYEIVGCILTDLHWSKFSDCIIIGLKKLDNLELLDNSSHIYFSHSYLNQDGSEQILKSFGKSQSILLDLEYFLDNNKRVVSFGYWAGYIGVILGLKQFYNKINGLEQIYDLKHWENIESAIDYVRDIKLDPKIKIGLIGPNGNCGSGAKKILNKLGLNYIPYYKNSDKSNLKDLDIVINCIKLDKDSNEIWFVPNSIYSKKLVIVDVSCDFTRPNNPIQLYKKSCTWENPIIRFGDQIDIIAIDNLPSLLPKESSDYFSKRLTDLILDLELDRNNFWKSNMEIYIEKITKYI